MVNICPVCTVLVELGCQWVNVFRFNISFFEKVKIKKTYIYTYIYASICLVLPHTGYASYWSLWVLLHNPAVFLMPQEHIFILSYGCIIFVLCVKHSHTWPLLPWPSSCFLSGEGKHISPEMSQTRDLRVDASSPLKSSEYVIKEIPFVIVRCRAALTRIIHNPSPRDMGGGAYIYNIYIIDIWYRFLLLDLLVI